MAEAYGVSLFFDAIRHLIEEAERQYGLANRNYTEYVVERFEYTITVCSDFCDHLRGVPGLDDYFRSTEELIAALKDILRKWEDYENTLEATSEMRPLTAHHLSVVSVGPGRPRFEISKEQLQYLSSLGFSWTEIASLLGVSRMTIYRRRVEYGLTSDPNAEVSDQELLSIIRSIRQDTVYSGVSMMWGSLRARGVKVTRERVRQALRSIDPISVALRWPAGATRRRPYSVAGPNSLWHIDSHHKLIRWRIVTHGALDEYTRLIVYLHASTNNQARTVYDLFAAAVRRHHLPSRVRSDQGTENILVAQYMLEKRGADRRSMITGCSVHNQRIERLWRDMHSSVTVLFYKMFYYLEQYNLLDHLNEHHLWALHYVFIPRINRCLQEFTNGWNNHPIRTATHKSPQQLFTAGCLLLQNSQLPALDFFHSVDETYGIDPDGPLPLSEGGISVPRSSLRFSDTDLHLLKLNIDPCGPSDNYGIDLYEQTLYFISSFTPL